jgi:intracellular sulfur oxidation DsrE/DsrF family protein
MSLEIKMRIIVKRVVAAVGLMALLSLTNYALADDGHHKAGAKSCENKTGGMSFDEEFGAGAGELTRCIEKRHKVKVVYQVNQFCRDDVALPECQRPYALGNISHAIEDYEVNYGMKAGKDYEIVAVVTSSGGNLMVQNQFARQGNQFEGLVRELMSKGVKFYFCQNTVRSMMKKNLITPGQATTEIIPGVKFVTAGVTAMPDFVEKGYVLIQP